MSEKTLNLQKIGKMEINLLNLIDESKCYELLRSLRWPDGLFCPKCSSNQVVKNGHDSNCCSKQCYRCQDCQSYFNDLTDTIFSDTKVSLKIWVVALYLMGLNLSNKQISKELDISEPTAQRMTRILREGIVKKKLIYNLQVRLRQTKFI